MGHSQYGFHSRHEYHQFGMAFGTNPNPAFVQVKHGKPARNSFEFIVVDTTVRAWACNRRTTAAIEFPGVGHV